MSDSVERKVLIAREFKSKSINNEVVRNKYGLFDDGVIIIQRFRVSKTLYHNSKVIREFGNLYYQVESMQFKYDSFFTIVQDLTELMDTKEVSDSLKEENIIR